MSDILDIQILDQYIIREREEVELWKIELSSNRAIILTKQLKTYEISNKYGGNLYIFDVSSPSEIVRLYPRKIRLYDPFDFFWIQIIAIFVIIPVTILSIPILIFALRKRKKRQQKQKGSVF